MPSGNPGSSARHACSRIPYRAGITLLASAIDIGTIAIVPLSVPVALLAYSSAIGFGWSYVWHVSNIAASLGCEKEQNELAYRMARMERKLKTKYGAKVDLACWTLGRDIVRKANTGWQRSARSRYVFIIFVSFSLVPSPCLSSFGLSVLLFTLESTHSNQP